MDQKDLDLIISLHKTQSLSKSAKDLYISQPALSKRLAQLEATYQTQLVIRHSKGILFTSQGEVLYQYASKINQEIQKLKDELLMAPQKITGTLRIGVSNIYAQYQLPKLLKAFAQQYPQVSFEITANRSTKIFEMIHNVEVHLAIVRGNFAWDHQKLKIAEEPVHIAHYEKVELEHLSEAGYIQYLTEPSFQAQINEWIHENLERFPRIVASTSSVETCLGLVKSGLGWSIVADIGLDHFSGYQWPLHKKDQTPLTRSTYLYFHEESLQLSPVKAFIKFMESLSEY